MDNEQRLIELIKNATQLLKAQIEPSNKGTKKPSERPHALDQISSSLKKCGAKTRSGIPCKNWGMRNGRCRLHGGKSTGPKTAEGLERLKKAHIKHGLYSADAIERRRQIRLGFARVESSQRIMAAALEIGKELLGKKVDEQKGKALADLNEFFNMFQQWYSTADLQGQDLNSLLDPQKINELPYKDKLRLIKYLLRDGVRSLTYLQNLRKSSKILIAELFSDKEEAEPREHQQCDSLNE